jgi:PTH2 family peptidyl-tRNA hydrolase
MIDTNSPEAVSQRASQEDPFVMYLIVRESLGMSIGKTAAQCAHASQMLLLQFHNEQLDWEAKYVDPVYGPSEPPSLELQLRWGLFEKWLDSSFRKVVLRANDTEWAKVKALPNHIVVVDAGLTEIAANSETVIGLWPMRKSERPRIIQKLQVLK